MVAIGLEEQKDLHELKEWVQGQGDGAAEAHVEKVLQAVSGHGGMHNASAILGDHIADSVKEAESHKNAGNRLFAEGKFDDALDRYQKALDLFKDYESMMLHSNTAAKKIIVTCYCNTAQACLKLSETCEKDDVGRIAESTRWAAEKALELEPSNIKARYRRGCSYVLKKDLNLARADFEWVLRVEPGNESAKLELRKLLKHQREEKKTAKPEAASSWKKAAAAMVSADSEDPRIACTEKAAAATAAKSAVEKQVFMASQLRKAVLKFYSAKGNKDEWEDKLSTELQADADELAESMEQQVSELLETSEDLQELGPQGTLLRNLDETQRRRFIVADAFVTTIKGACGPDFADIVSMASTLED